MEIILASTNKGKIKELKKMLEKYDINILSLKDINYTDEIEENGTTFEENAIIKAKTISRYTNKIVISDDSGIEIRALNNEPGIYSARYSGLGDIENNNLVLRKMKDKTDMYAQYVAVICLYFPNGTYKTYKGICAGEITLNPRGENGFGYDPLFYLPSYNKTMAELDMDEKNKISHRSKALHLMCEDIDLILNYK